MITRWMRYGGLAVPSLAWTIETELGQVTPYIDCQRHASWTPALSAALLVASAVAIVMSFRYRPQTAAIERFIAYGGCLIALAFVFALVLQGAASLLLDPCQR